MHSGSLFPTAARLNLMDQFKNIHACEITATEYMAIELLYRQMAKCLCEILVCPHSLMLGGITPCLHTALWC